MKKLTISFLGRDCPGIVSAVSQILGQTGCNIIEVTQTILCGEFAAIFIVQAPENVTEESLHTQLALGLVDAKLDLSVLVRPAVEGRWEDSVVSQPFVVTVDGPDRPGLIAAMSRVFARHGVNCASACSTATSTKPSIVSAPSRIPSVPGARQDRLRKYHKEYPCFLNAKLSIRSTCSATSIWTCAP